jgi:hypothetical protein
MTGEDLPNRRIAEQVFVVSAAMVGVCLTLMGLVGIISSLDSIATLTDELLAAVAMVFLVACLSAYLSLRTASVSMERRWERVADIAFVIGMVAMVLVGALVALLLI